MPEASTPSAGLDRLSIATSLGFVVVFLVATALAGPQIADLIDAGFTWTATNLGSVFEWLLIATFIIALGVAFGPAGQARIGNAERPDLGTFQWLSIILCTLLAGGGVFFAAGEPVYHYLNTPPAFDTAPGTPAAVPHALAQSFMHWGFLAWAILGALTALVLARAHYDLGQPLRPRALLLDTVPNRWLAGPLGSLVDSVCVIAVVAGTVGPIGFLATQVGYGLHVLVGTPEGLATQLMIVAALGLVYVTSAVTGITRGIQWLSRFNVVLALVIGVSSTIHESAALFALTLLRLWSLAVYGFIFQRALEIHIGFGIAMALFVVVFTVAITQTAISP